MRIATLSRVAQLVAAVIAASPAPGFAGDAARPVLPVRLYDTTSVPEAELSMMQATAEKALASANLTIQWTPCIEHGRGGCAAVDGPDVILRITDEHRTAGRCGYALPDRRGGGFVSLSLACVKRVRDTLERGWTEVELTPIGEGEMLGIILAHELAHILLPGADHSHRGLFKSRLHARDWKSVRRQGLRFLERDVDRLREAAGRLWTTRVHDARSAPQ